MFNVVCMLVFYFILFVSDNHDMRYNAGAIFMKFLFLIFSLRMINTINIALGISLQLMVLLPFSSTGFFNVSTKISCSFYFQYILYNAWNNQLQFTNDFNHAGN